MLASFPLLVGFVHASPSLSLGLGCGCPFHVQKGRDMVDLLPIHQPFPPKSRSERSETRVWLVEMLLPLISSEMCEDALKKVLTRLAI